MAAPKPSEPLRYPREALHDTTDYLKIEILKYQPSISITKGVNEKAYNTLSDKKSPLGRKFVDFKKTYEDTPGNRAEFLKRQGYAYSQGTVNIGKPRSIKTNKTPILLPIPSNIQDGNSVKYTEGSLDGLTAKALGIALGAFGPGSDDKVVSQLISDTLKGTIDAAISDEARSYFTRTLAAQAANVAGGNLTASQLLARQSGNIINPNMELLFDGVTLRSFKFSFKMTPRNGKEAEEIKKIIRLLKRTMSPGLGGEFGPDGTTKLQTKDFYLNTPHLYQLSYMRGRNTHPFLHKFKPCFLTDMSVNYTGEGTYAVYGDSADGGGGTPVSMIMDLGFKEVEPIYSQDYATKEGQDGVGF